MKMNPYLADIISELQQAANQLDGAHLELLVEPILRSRKVFVAGAGRSGLMVRAFAMRLMHLGIDAYVVGETVTPGLTRDDLLIVGSGSGETRSLLSMAEKAKNLGASIAVFTISPESSLGRIADRRIQLPGSPKEQSAQVGTSIQPMGSLFEQMLLLSFDAVILKLMAEKGQNAQTMFGRHANLE